VRLKNSPFIILAATFALGFIPKFAFSQVLDVTLTEGKKKALILESLTEQSFTIQRTKVSDGSPDTSFGSNGKTTINVYSAFRKTRFAKGSLSPHFSIGKLLSVTSPRGDIIVAGNVRFTSKEPTRPGQLINELYREIHKSDLPPGSEAFEDLVNHFLRDHGSLTGENFFFLTRLNQQGKIDTSFGDQGFVFPLMSKDTEEEIDTLNVTAEESILISICGEIYSDHGSDSKWNDHFALYKFKANGNQDENFGTLGRTRVFPHRLLPIGYIQGLSQVYLHSITEATNGDLFISAVIYADLEMKHYPIPMKLSSNGRKLSRLGAQIGPLDSYNPMDGNFYGIGMTIDPQGENVYIARDTFIGKGSTLLRYSSETGQMDRSFGTKVRSFFVTPHALPAIPISYIGQELFTTGFNPHHKNQLIFQPLDQAPIRVPLKLFCKDAL